MSNDVIDLISYVESADEYGIITRTESSRSVMADVKSITQSEFYQAQASGLKPEYKFVLADYYDYNGEKELEYDNVRYSIKRTFRTGNALELIAYGLNT